MYWFSYVFLSLLDQVKAHVRGQLSAPLIQPALVLHLKWLLWYFFCWSSTMRKSIAWLVTSCLLCRKVRYICSDSGIMAIFSIFPYFSAFFCILFYGYSILGISVLQNTAIWSFITLRPGINIIGSRKIVKTPFSVKLYNGKMMQQMAVK